MSSCRKLIIEFNIKRNFQITQVKYNKGTNQFIIEIIKIKSPIENLIITQLQSLNNYTI